MLQSLVVLLQNLLQLPVISLYQQNILVRQGLWKYDDIPMEFLLQLPAKPVID